MEERSSKEEGNSGTPPISKPSISVEDIGIDVVRSLFESSPDSIVVTDLQGSVILFNKRFEQMHGITDPEKTRGRNVFSFVSEDDQPRLGKHFREIFSTAKPGTASFILIREDGSTFPAEVTANPVNGGDGTIVAVIAVARDMTEARAAEQVVVESESRYKAILNATTESVMMVDLQGRIASVNDVAAKRLGKTVEELTGMVMEDFLPPEVAKSRRVQGEKILETKEPIVYQDKRAGRYYESKIFPVFGSSGEVSALAIFAQDITEQKLSEKALKESEERYRSLFRESGDGIFIMDGDHFVECNERSASLFGYASPDQLVGVHPWDLSPPTQPDGAPSREKAMALMETAIEDKPQEFYWKHKKKDGTLIDCEVSLSPLELEGKNYIQAIVRDVSERRKAQAALFRSEKRYRALFDNSSTGVILHEVILNDAGKPVDYVFLEANPASERLIDMKADQLVGKRLSKVFPDLVGHDVVSKYFKVAMTGEPESFETRVGRLGKHFEVSVFSPSINQFATVFSDITERKQAEEQLKQSLEDLAEAQEIGRFGSWDIDLETGLIHASPNLAKIFGLDGSEGSESIDLEMASSFIHPDDHDIFLASVTEAMEKKEPVNREFRIIRSDGDIRTLYSQGKTVYDKEGCPTKLFGTMQDITERKRNEEKQRDLFLELQHRVKNNMQLISSILDMEKAQLGDSPMGKSLDDIQGVVHTMSLIHASAYRDQEIKDINITALLGRLVKGVLDIYKAKDFTVEFSVTGDELLMDIDQSSPVSLLVNEMVFNSLKHAFEKGTHGKISIDIKKVLNEVELRVRDDGRGLPEGFSIEKASSLGLKLVRALVRQLNGSMEIIINDGTEFFIKFPLREKGEGLEQFREG